MISSHQSRGPGRSPTLDDAQVRAARTRSWPRCLRSRQGPSFNSMVLTWVARVSVEGPCPGRCGFRLCLYPAAGVRQEEVARIRAGCMVWLLRGSSGRQRSTRGFPGGGGVFERAEKMSPSTGATCPWQSAKGPPTRETRRARKGALADSRAPLFSGRRSTRVEWAARCSFLSGPNEWSRPSCWVLVFPFYFLFFLPFLISRIQIWIQV
jgi:hypothetical protein